MDFDYAESSYLLFRIFRLVSSSSTLASSFLATLSILVICFWDNFIVALV
jgi:hypothetical protein